MRRPRTLVVFFLATLAAALGLALSAPKPAQAAPVQIIGGETRLQVNIAFFIANARAGISVGVIPPARLEFGASPMVIFPVRPGGTADGANAISTVMHDGGLVSSKGTTVLETTNITVLCTTGLGGCGLWGTGMGILPTQLAELRDFQFSDNGFDTITFTADARLTATAALALNTLFETNEFVEGMQIGLITGTWNYAPTITGYPRPQGATPVRVSLVPAFDTCTAPNSSHGAPLASPSCNAPGQSSLELTVGTPDANGAGANSRAFVRYAVVPGNPSTTDDEADVGIDVGATDVRLREDLSDYEGELQALVDLRITDRRNSMLPPIVPDEEIGTAQDVPLAVTVPCTATSDPGVGSECKIETTAETVLPGVVREGDRSIWELGQVRLTDGGPDGDAETAENTVFAVQGIFVP